MSEQSGQTEVIILWYCEPDYKKSLADHIEQASKFFTRKYRLDVNFVEVRDVEAKRLDGVEFVEDLPGRHLRIGYVEKDGRRE